MTNCIYHIDFENYVHYFIYNNYCARYFLFLILDKVVCPFLVKYFETVAGRRP